MRFAILGFALFAVTAAAPLADDLQSQKGVLTDLATTVQHTLDNIDHILHPDAGTVVKRSWSSFWRGVGDAFKDAGKEIAHTVTELAPDIADGLEIALKIAEDLHGKRDLPSTAQKLEAIIGELSHILSPSTKRGILTDINTISPQTRENINHILHPDMEIITKRSWSSFWGKVGDAFKDAGKAIAHTVEKIPDLITEYAPDIADGLDIAMQLAENLHGKRDLPSTAQKLEAIIGELSHILSPSTKRGILTDIATQIQHTMDTMDSTDHALHHDAATVTRRGLLTDLATQIQLAIHNVDH